MPWHVAEKNSEFCVIKDGDDSVVACHPTKEEASKHVAALYANENAELAMKVLVDSGLSDEDAEKMINDLIQDLNSSDEGPKNNASDQLTSWLLERLPEGFSDEDAERVRSALEQALEDDTSGGSSVSGEKSYTEGDLKAAIEEAIKPLEAKLAEVEEASSAAEVEQKLEDLKAELTAAHEAALEELNTKLDAQDLELSAAKEAVANFENEKAEFEGAVAHLEEEKAEAARLEALKTERTDQVKEVAPHVSDERVEENAERWAKMDEEAFEALLESYKDFEEVASASSGRPPRTTKLSSARENDDETASHGKSSLGAIKQLRAAGYRDASRIRN